mmetsp:Transcript_26944/g.69709  ORF Transcript_26944/g.69709 Transcript_26944/m.69709 type:complete len:897 (-) Transcript_26944:172-2862(-)
MTVAAGRRVGRIAPRFSRCQSSSSSQLPSDADVVIIGGGSIGCSTAYHFAQRGLKPVVLERHQLTAGTTWHTAGMLWRLRPNDVAIQLQAHTRNMCKQLEQETGIQSWVENGGLFVATNPERLAEYKRLSTLGVYFGVDSHVLGPREVKELYPLLNVEDVYGAIYSPGDGTIDPAGVCQAYSKAARKLGATVAEGVSVRTVEMTTGSKNGVSFRQVHGVVTTDGHRIATPLVINAAGAWSNAVAEMCQVKIPLRAMKHAYVVTESIEGVHPGLPNMRDHDLSIYFKTQGDSLALGGYEPNPEFWQKADPNFAFGLFDLDWDTFSHNLEGHFSRCSAIENVGIKSTVCGPEAFTPDHQPLIGPDVDVSGLFHACGFNSMGMMLAGVGREIATWAVDGSPGLDLFHFDVARFHPSNARNDRWVEDRTHESYAKTYSIVFPHDESLAGRGQRRSALYDVLSERGCVWQARHGFERPGWFLLEQGRSVQPVEYDFYGAYGDAGSVIPGLERPVPARNQDDAYLAAIEGELTFGWGECFDRVATECNAVRNGVAFFDQSYFGKFELTGEDANEACDWLCSAHVGSRPVGDVVYTALCNVRGGVEADVTVTKIAENHFYLCTGGANASHTWRWLTSNLRNSEFSRCSIEDRSDYTTILSVQGPRSQEVLERALDVSLAGLGFSKMSSIRALGQDAMVMRLTFVGELGFELHLPATVAAEVYRAVRDSASRMSEQQGFPVEDAGYRCIDSLSGEKGYRHWHADLSNEDTPAEAGIGFVALQKLKAGIPFLGSEALSKQRSHGLRRRLICLSVPRTCGALHGGETLWRNGECVGYVKSTAFGHSIGRTVAYGYCKSLDGSKVTNAWLEQGEYAIQDKGVSHPATLHLKSPFDPENKRIKGIYDQ